MFLNINSQLQSIAARNQKGSKVKRNKKVLMKGNIFSDQNLLIIITIGSTLLAFPGALGSLYLLNGAIVSIQKAYFAQKAYFLLGLLVLLPPLIGFALLFGYYWTLFSNRVKKGFWIISFIFNLITHLTQVIEKGVRFLHGRYSRNLLGLFNCIIWFDNRDGSEQFA